jgi:hypothetical protein
MGELMNWTQILEDFFEMLKAPSGFGVVAILIVSLLVALCAPLGILTYAFLKVGDGVIAHMDQGFNRIERVLERKSVAIRGD